MENWVKTIELNLLKSKGSVPVRVDNRKLLLIYTNSEVFCIENRCTHENIELSEGVIEDDEIMCPEHGSRFSIKTGEALCLPATNAVPTYPVKAENGFIFCNLNPE